MSTSGKVTLAVLLVFAVLVWLTPVAAGLYYEKQLYAGDGEA